MRLTWTAMRAAGTSLAALYIFASVLLAPSAYADSPSPDFGDAFWQHWGDGLAEVSGYALTYPRYGQLRKGTAVAIFVTESFDPATGVKTERAATTRGAFPVIKLNLVQDFPTGVYDYNTMTSVFVAAEPVNGYAAGAVTKASFGSQEWCGHVYQQVVFDSDAVAHQLHSYFEGEADQARSLPVERDGVSEDALLLWARGLAGPGLEPGQSVRVPLLRSMQTARFGHVPLVWDAATLSRGDDATTVTVPAGEFVVDRYTVRIERSESKRTYGRAVPADPGPHVWTIDVERARPHRVVRWATDDGREARLLGSDRMAYWSMNGNGSESVLRRIGLTPRGERMP